MNVQPLTLRQANEFVKLHHRHHKPTQGHRFSLGCFVDGVLCGVIIVGRPVARGCDPYLTAEVTRCCTDGTKNACSFLYGAASRVCKAMGFKTIQTYTLPEEGGKSLKASGWTLLGEAGGGGWVRRARPNRCTDQPMQTKFKWERCLE